MAALARLPLSGEATRAAETLAEVAEGIRVADTGLAITIDPVENRGFEYHTGVTFTFFMPGLQGELGNGGRYEAGSGETATGFTLFMDTLMEALPPPEASPRVFLPFGISGGVGERLRAEGWITVNGLEETRDTAAEALRLGCTHLMAGDAVEELARRDK